MRVGQQTEAPRRGGQMSGMEAGMKAGINAVGTGA